MKKILAIDDQADNLTTIKAVIKSHMTDCKVLTAPSGSEGLKIAKEEQPDTILLDIIMPGMDGYEVCKRLKEDELTKYIPIVMITAIKTDSDSRVYGLNTGADAFLSKPIDPIELTAQVNVMLRIKEAEDKLRAEKELLDQKVKERTKDLKKSEELNRSITQTAADAIISINADGIIMSWNNAAEKIFGYSSSEMMNRELLEIIPDKYKAGHEHCIIQLKRGSSEKLIGKTIELTALRKDGTEFPIELSLSSWETGPQNNYTGIIRDITERKRAEQIQKILYNISNAAISSGNLKKLISLIQIELGTIIDTTNFYVALYNPKTDTLSLPFITDEKNESQHFPAGKTLTKYVIKTQKSFLGTKEAIKKLEKSGEIEKFGPDSKIWLGVPLIIEGKITGVFAVQSYTDEFAYDESDMEILEFIADQISISIERKKAEQGLKGALEKATESDSLKSAFLATMSHELRTPLNAIIGFSDIIDEGMPIEKIIDYTKIINSSGNHLLTIVEDIFNISLIESGEIKIMEEDVSLQTVLNDVHAIIKIEQQNTNKGHLGLVLKIPASEKDLIIQTDPSKLKQILINLLKNALKFTDDGHVHFGYNIETVQGKSAIKFYVEDTGIGIEADMFGLIFEIFRQVDDSNTRMYGGTGIGLSISKKLTELLGGRIWLDSEKGKGSTFYFFIPFKEYKKISKPFINKAKKESRLNGKTVLIVEDVEVSFELLKIVFEKSGINTIWAIDGKTAIEYCKENKNIGLILMDINMPDMDGYETTRQIRKFNKDIVIIAQTAYALAGDREKALEAGCDDYLTKPIKKEVLMTIIKNYEKDPCN
ncbi:MAG: response regulator [Bacteroidales bacterium]|nr:response regulator [Bacteroidales bacterium]